MQTRVWVVPGFLGSELHLVQLSTRNDKAIAGKKLWIDVAGAAAGLDTQALTYPTPGGLGAVIPGGIVDALGYGYGSLYRHLLANKPADWTLMPYPWDWRRDVLSVAQELAAAIQAQPAVPGGDLLVAHSLGACVACAAWAYLRQSNAQARVPRIVTIGGILSGSYGTVKTWLFQEDGINQLSLAAFNPFRQARGYGFGNTLAAKLLLVQCFNSWPSVYDMLPAPDGADDPGDMLRAKVWDSAVWANAPAPPDSGLLASSRALYQAFRADPGNWPPPGVLVNVVGTGKNTPYRLQPAALAGVGPIQYRVANPAASGLQYALSQLPNLATTARGDNRGTVASQSRPGCQALFVEGDHGDLVSHPVVLANLIGLLTGPGASSGATNPVTVPVWPLSA